MICYFSSEIIGSSDNPVMGVVSFVIPEIDVTFRAPYVGTAMACEYASLFALLEFVEINPGLFRGRVLEIFGDAIMTIREVNAQSIFRADVGTVCELVSVLKGRIPCKIGWISPAENPARLRW